MRAHLAVCPTNIVLARPINEVNYIENMATYFRIGAYGKISWEIFVQLLLQGAKPKSRVSERVCVLFLHALIDQNETR